MGWEVLVSLSKTGLELALEAVQGWATDMPRSLQTEMGFTQRTQAPGHPAPVGLGWNAEPLTLDFVLFSPLQIID